MADWLNCWRRFDSLNGALKQQKVTFIYIELILLLIFLQFTDLAWR